MQVPGFTKTPPGRIESARRRLDEISGAADSRADRVTLSLAAIAVATAGSVIVGEVVRLARRRIRESARPEEDGVHAGHASMGVAGRATQDTIVVALEGYGATPRRELVLFNMLTGFVGAFAFVRISTAGIRDGWWPTGNVRIGGRHIHHFVSGILVAFASGAASLLSTDTELEEKLAFPFGAGVGLTFDEAALLLDLRDVYWTREGLLSVQVSLGFAAVMGGTIMALRMLRRGEQRVEASGLIPPDPGFSWPIPTPTGNG